MQNRGTKNSGFSLLEVIVIMAITLVLSLGTVSMLRVFQKSAKQVLELNAFSTHVSLIQRQLQQMNFTDSCVNYFKNSNNTKIYTATVSDPSDPTKVTPMTLMTEANAPNAVRIGNGKDVPATYIQGDIYQVILTTTDNVCDKFPDKWCSGTLNLVVKRPLKSSGADYFGLSAISEGFETNQGFLANIVFKTDAPGGALKECSYMPQWGGVDYGTCGYYSDPNNLDNSLINGTSGEQAPCPATYVGVAACAGGCFGKGSSSIVCCRLRDPSRLKKEKPGSLTPTSHWTNQCGNGEVVTGVCNGSCAGQNMQCSKVDASFGRDYLCRKTALGGGMKWCKAGQVITEYCPSGGSGCPHPGYMMCCPFK